MKVKEVPQDGPEQNIFDTTLMQYAVDDNGQFITTPSNGWETTHTAVTSIQEEFKEREEKALKRVKNGETSPLEYFMYKAIMDIDTLSQMSGYSKRKIRKHMNPRMFDRLSEDVLVHYAQLFLTDVSTIKNLKKELP